MLAIYQHVSDAVRWIYDRRIDAPPILDRDIDFPNGARFVAAWQDMHAEALAIARTMERVPRFHDIMQEQEGISANDGRDWRMHVMQAYGAPVRENLARCPTIARLLRECPEVLSATYSFLAPGKHVPEHRGPFRGIMRFHVGLSMPRNAAGELGAILWVDGVPHKLDNGDCMLWDDTYPHEVLNATDEVRIALLLDVWRPRQPPDMAALSSVIVSTARAFAARRPDAFVG
ncbi:MAG TPA: aspartyl/asparaginyl beta-hydroxylase domain-containing protein [Rhizomicrobium sp.]|jgi:aspartate beta-hydroxylase|nr:aspartyl/asparaginyl beta-hydroxylase domain-containing protein [Rhizomicrobium sp.]